MISKMKITHNQRQRRRINLLLIFVRPLALFRRSCLVGCSAGAEQDSKGRGRERAAAGGRSGGSQGRGRAAAGGWSRAA
jgi:hypothetical protein